VYEGEEATHDDKLTTHLQCLEEQFDRFEPFLEQIGAQVEQFVVMGCKNNRRHRPNPNYAKEKNKEGNLLSLAGSTLRLIRRLPKTHNLIRIQINKY
jgi:hypothetical protein